MPNALFIGGPVAVYEPAVDVTKGLTFGNVVGNLPTVQDSQRWMGALHGNNAANTSDARAKCFITTPGTYSRLKILVSAAPGAGVTWTFVLRKNGTTDTGIVVTIADSATSGEDLTHTAAVVGTDGAQDYLTLQCTVTGGTAAAASASWCMQFEPTTTKQQNLCFNTYSTSLSTSATQYLNLAGNDGNIAAAIFDAQIIAPSAGTIKNLYVVLSGTAGGDGRVFGVNINGQAAGSETLKVTLATGDASKSNYADSVSVSAGDLICISSSIPSGTPTAREARGGVTFVNATDGQFIIPFYAGGTNLSNLTTYGMIDGLFARDTTSTFGTSPVSTAFTAKTMYVQLEADPGSGKSFAIAYAHNGTAQALAVTVTGNGSNGTTGNNSTDVSTAATDVVNMKQTPSGTPTLVGITWGVLGQI